MAIHDATKKPFACSHAGCFLRFVTEASLKKHEILHRNPINYADVVVKQEKTYKCLVCSKTFPIQEALGNECYITARP